MDKLQTSWNGRGHSMENNACLFSICVTDLPGQREVVSCVVVTGGREGGLPSDREKCYHFLFPALLSDIVGWWCPFVLTLWRGSSPAEWGAAKRSSSYAQLDREPSSHQHMPPAVQCQVIWPGEAAVTVCALEWLDSRVFAVMPRQFIRTSELPGAAFPGTLVGLLSWKRQRDRTLCSIISPKQSGQRNDLGTWDFPFGGPLSGNLTTRPAAFGPHRWGFQSTLSCCDNGEVTLTLASSVMGKLLCSQTIRRHRLITLGYNHLW